jgi:hypothetical protein
MTATSSPKVPLTMLKPFEAPSFHAKMATLRSGRFAWILTLLKDVLATAISVTQEGMHLIRNIATPRSP